jgi:SCP-2 sterol transfer family
MARRTPGVSILEVDRRSTATADFFEKLGRRGHEPLLEVVDATIRFDLRDEHGIDHWFVVIKNGDVQVSRDDRPADCIVHTDRAVFDQLVTGQLQSQSAWLRHLFRMDGDAGLMRLFDRILPGPPNARDPRDLVPSARRR